MQQKIATHNTECMTQGHDGCKVIKVFKDGWWQKVRIEHRVYGRVKQEHLI